MTNNVISFRLWEVHEFFWGTAVRERRTGMWVRVFLKPNGQEVNVENLIVAIHENGIEFL